MINYFVDYIIMSNSTNSTNSSNGETILPKTPSGLRRFVVISKDPPKKGFHKEIHAETSFDKLLEDIHVLHAELEAVHKTGSKIIVDCSNCFACLRGNNISMDADIKVKDNKATTI
jgi:hypothetical protein